MLPVELSFSRFINIKEGKENLDQPHVVSADPPMKLPPSLERIFDAFKKSKEVPIGKEVDSKSGGEKDVTMKSRKIFIVGDTVRDHLLGHTPDGKFEIVTDAHPDEIIKIMHGARPPIPVIKKDKNGSVKVSVDGDTYTIETMKKKEGSLTVNPGEDCERRGFTCDALYYDPIAKKIYDYTGGLRHLKDGEVKFIGRAEDRIAEDGTRKYKYARLVNKLPNGKVDDKTKASIMGTEGEAEPESIRQEFWRGMEDLHTAADKYIKTYRDLGLLDTVFPDLKLSDEFPNCRTCKSKPVALAHLLKDNHPQKLVQVLKKLGYTDREIKDAVFLINLLIFSPEYVHEYKQELMQSSLSKRQIQDWVKSNHLDMKMIDKLMEYEPSNEARYYY